MSIKQTITTSIVALTMAALVAPAATGAVTVSDLQAQIAALEAQLAQLQGSSSTSTSASTPAACVSVTFTRNLHVGMTGNDVKCLQAILNATGYPVAASGVGSMGHETNYFGPKTLVAVKLYQKATLGVTASQVGPMTRAKLNAWLTSGSGSSNNNSGNNNNNNNNNTTPMGAGLNVSVASGNPASGTVVSSAALVPLVKLSFHNGDSTQVKVTSLSLHRMGVSADAALKNVYLFDGANRLTDAASVSQGVVNFNDSTGLFTVDSGATRSITVYSDLNGSSGNTLGLTLNAATDVATNASSVTGTFPINGNLMSLATATLDTVNFNATTTPAAANINPQNAVTLWENLTSVSGSSNVTLSWMRFHYLGTADSSAIQNFQLYIDGTQVGSAVASMDANRYITFDLTSAPVTLQTGTRDIKVVADIIGGSNRTVQLELRTAADVRATDSQYGANILSTFNGASFSTIQAGAQTINSGTITVQKTSDSPSANVVKNANSQVLARYTLTASGEAVKVDTITALFASSNACTKLRNGAIYANGVQVGSTADLGTTDTAYSMGSSLIVNPGTPTTLEIRADVYCDDGTNTLASGDTVTATLDAGASNGTGQVSYVTSNVPSADISGNTLTVKVGSLTLSKYTAYTNQTVVAPLTGFAMAHFTLTNSTTEAINLNEIDVTNAATLYSSMTNEYVMYGTQKTTVTATPGSSQTYSISSQLPAGQTIDVIAYSDVNPSTIGTFNPAVSVEVKGTTAQSATSVQTNSNAVLAGQQITFTTGSINAVVDGTTPIQQAVSGGQAVTAGIFKFVASNDNYTLTELKFTVHGNNGAIINSADLWDGTTKLGEVPFDSTNNWFYFTGLNEAVPANTTKLLSLSLNLGTPSINNGVVTTGKNVAVTLSYIKTLNGNGVMHDAGSGTLSSSDASVTIAGTTTGTSAGNYLYVYKTLPTFASVAVTGQGTALSSGSQVNLYSFTVGADAKGPVSLRQLKFVITDGAVNGTNDALSTFKFFRGSTDLTQQGAVTIMRASDNASITGATSITSGTVIVNFYGTGSGSEEVIPAGTTRTYTLAATPAGYSTSSSGSDSVTTVLSLPTDTTSPGVAAGADVTHDYLDGASSSGLQTLYTAANDGGVNGSAADVIWSDNSAASHNYVDSATTSGDWFNGYLINNLPLTSNGISAS